MCIVYTPVDKISFIFVYLFLVFGVSLLNYLILFKIIIYYYYLFIYLFIYSFIYLFIS